MTIVGTGIDLVEVPRFENAVKRWGTRFLKRLFTPRELKYAQVRKTAMQHLAARFAAKEAVVKAMGAPKGLALEWKDLEIVHAPSGQPQVAFHRSMQSWAKYRVHLSLTHTGQHAIAAALVIKP